MTDRARARLATILGMLGSEHAGERAAAGLQAEAFRKKHGLTWADFRHIVCLSLICRSVAFVAGRFRGVSIHPLPDRLNRRGHADHVGLEWRPTRPAEFARLNRLAPSSIQ
jgi:hypothetical protein